MLDNALKREILAVVRMAAIEARDDREEVWLTGESLCKQFQMFSPGWLKRFGSRLPRTQVVVTDDNGDQHVTSWAYPRNKIQRMIRNNEIKLL